MADHQEIIHAAAPAAVSGASTTPGSHGGDWWSAAVVAPPAVSSCSAPETMQRFGGWSAAVVDGKTSRSAGNIPSSESPGSLATGSSITFQEPTGVADPATIAMHAQTVAGGGWNQQPLLDGSGFHGYMSSRSDHTHHHQINTPSLMSHSSSNNSVMLQEHHNDQNYQFLSNLGFELLSSPTSPYGGGGGFRSSLLRSLTEPAAVKPSSPGFQQYHHHQPAMNLQPPAAAGREPRQLTNSTAPFWSPSSGFTVAAEGTALGATGASPASLAAKSALEGVGDSSSIITKKAKVDSTPLKKSRTGTPSPLPTTFKVRKEKLGDRITALQQLVSPFGKTDTASVLHETIEYVKFLHDQVVALSAPYLKNRQQLPHLKNSGDSDGGGGEAMEASKRDLTGRGLCLVPISSTFSVASETPVDFWTPFGAPFR